MEMYKKPVMEIVELEEVDVLTASCLWETCTKPTVDGLPVCEEHRQKYEESLGK